MADAIPVHSTPKKGKQSAKTEGTVQSSEVPGDEPVQPSEGLPGSSVQVGPRVTELADGVIRTDH